VQSDTLSGIREHGYLKERTIAGKRLGHAVAKCIPGVEFTQLLPQAIEYRDITKLLTSLIVLIPLEIRYRADDLEIGDPALAVLRG
jgi:hypothetical protein